MDLPENLSFQQLQQLYHDVQTRSQYIAIPLTILSTLLFAVGLLYLSKGHTVEDIEKSIKIRGIWSTIVYMQQEAIGVINPTQVIQALKARVKAGKYKPEQKELETALQTALTETKRAYVMMSLPLNSPIFTPKPHVIYNGVTSSLQTRPLADTGLFDVNFEMQHMGSQYSKVAFDNMRADTKEVMNINNSTTVIIKFIEAKRRQSRTNTWYSYFKPDEFWQHQVTWKEAINRFYIDVFFKRGLTPKLIPTKFSQQKCEENEEAFDYAFVLAILDVLIRHHQSNICIPHVFIFASLDGSLHSEDSHVDLPTLSPNLWIKIANGEKLSMPQKREIVPVPGAVLAYAANRCQKFQQFFIIFNIQDDEVGHANILIGENNPITRTTQVFRLEPNCTQGLSSIDRAMNEAVIQAQKYTTWSLNYAGTYNINYNIQAKMGTNNCQMISIWLLSLFVLNPTLSKEEILGRVSTLSAKFLRQHVHEQTVQLTAFMQEPQNEKYAAKFVLDHLVDSGCHLTDVKFEHVL